MPDNNEFDLNNMYKAIVENMVDGFSCYKVLFDENGQPYDFIFCDVNKSFENITGMKREFIINKKVSELYSSTKDVETDWADLVVSAIISGEATKTDVYSPSVKKWFSCSTFSLRQGYFATVFHDINDFKETETKLKENEYKFQFALEGCGDAIWDWNIETNKVTYSTNCKSLIGYEAEEMPDNWQEWTAYIHPEDRETASQKMLELITGVTPSYNFEFRLRCKNGYYKWLMCRGKIFRYNEKGIPSMVIGLNTDISHRKAIEEDLRESEEKYRKMFEANRDAAFFVNDDTGEILDANPAASKLYGYSKEDLLKLKGENFEIEHNRFKVINFRNNKNKVPFIDNSIHIKKDGSSFPVEVSISPFTYKGCSVSTVFVHDVSNSKRIEELEKEAAKNLTLLKESKFYESLRTDFFANISHELRTPLNVILGSLQLIELYMDNCLNCSSNIKFMKYTKMMHQNCFRLLRLVNNLIDITKIDAGYLDLNLENKNIVKIVEDITLSVAEYIENKSINLIFDTETEERIMSVDSDAIERIMLNLLSNSIKFTRPGGSIFVNLYEENEKFIISVKDTGIGIPKDKQQIVFNRFMQVDKSLTRTKEGSGIGLSLVKSLVELHGGSINLKSELDIGSEFIIELPIKTVPQTKSIYSNVADLNQSHVERIVIEFSDIYS